MELIEITGVSASTLAQTLGKMWDDARTSTVWGKLSKQTRSSHKKQFALHLAGKTNGDAVSRSFDAARMLRDHFEYLRAEATYRNLSFNP